MYQSLSSHSYSTRNMMRIGIYLSVYNYWKTSTTGRSGVSPEADLVATKAASRMNSYRASTQWPKEEVAHFLESFGISGQLALDLNIDGRVLQANIEGVLQELGVDNQALAREVVDSWKAISIKALTPKFVSELQASQRKLRPRSSQFQSVKSDNSLEMRADLDVEMNEQLRREAQRQQRAFDTLQEEHEALLTSSEEREFAYSASRAEVESLTRKLLRLQSAKSVKPTPTISFNECAVQTDADLFEEPLGRLEEKLHLEEKHSKSMHQEFMLIKDQFEQQISHYEMDIVDLESEIRKLQHDLQVEKEKNSFEFQQFEQHAHEEVERLKALLEGERSQRVEERTNFEHEVDELKHSLQQMQSQQATQHRYPPARGDPLSRSIGTMEDISDIDFASDFNTMKVSGWLDAPETNTVQSGRLARSLLETNQSASYWPSTVYPGNLHSPSSFPTPINDVMWREKEIKYLETIDYLVRLAQDLSQLHERSQNSWNNMSLSRNQNDGDSLKHMEGLRWFVPQPDQPLSSTSSRNGGQTNTQSEPAVIVPPSFPPLNLLNRPVLHYQTPLQSLNVIYQQKEVMPAHEPTAQEPLSESAEPVQEACKRTSAEEVESETAKHSSGFNTARSRSSIGKEPNLVAPFITQVRPRTPNANLVPQKPKSTDGTSSVVVPTSRGDKNTASRPGRRVVGYSFPVRSVYS